MCASPLIRRSCAAPPSPTRGEGKGCRSYSLCLTFLALVARMERSEIRVVSFARLRPGLRYASSGLRAYWLRSFAPLVSFPSPLLREKGEACPSGITLDVLQLRMQSAN